MPENNYIKDWLAEQERSIRWLARKTDIKYQTLYSILNRYNNRQLYDHLTLKQLDHIERIIPDVKQQLRERA